MELENNNLENENNDNTDNIQSENNDNMENAENIENNNEEENRYRGDRGERRHYFNRDSRDSGDKEGNIQNNNPRRRFFRKKVCFFCKNDIDILDYKDIKLLKRYIKESGKIVPKRLNGTCAKHQRMVTKAVKRARNIAILPYETRYWELIFIYYIKGVIYFI